MSDEQKMPPETELDQAGVDADSEAVVDAAAAEPSAAEAEAESGEASAEESVESLQAKIESLEEELGKTKDEALRTLAEAHNIRRRSDAEVEKARKFALEKFAGDLLAVVDNLERAIDVADRDSDVVKPLLEGIELTQKSLVDTLGRFDVTPVDPQGEPFDPQFHQAMSMVENPDVEPNTVTVVMQKGYTINGRLLRPAMVMVSKPATNSVDEQA